MNKQLKKTNVSKEISRKLKVYIPAQNAASLTTLNAVLGQAGINAFEFGKRYNKLTECFLNDIIINLEVISYIDKTFEIFIKAPTVSSLILEEACVFNKLKEFPENFPNTNTIGIKSLYQVAFLLKNKVLHTSSLKAIFRSLCGVAKSMHIKIVNDLN